MDFKTNNELEQIINDLNKKWEDEWNAKTPQEKINSYKEQGVYSRYCDMTIEELEVEKQFQKETANRLRHSIFGDPYYSAYGCDENVRRINTILKLKKEIRGDK